MIGSPFCNNNSLKDVQSQLDNSFIVPLEETFTESTEVESLKRNMCSSESSPGNTKLVAELYMHVSVVYFNHELWNSLEQHCAFSDLTLLVGHQEEHPACKNSAMQYWCGCLF